MKRESRRATSSKRKCFRSSDHCTAFGSNEGPAAAARKYKMMMAIALSVLVH